MFMYGFPLPKLFTSSGLRDLSWKVSDNFPGLLLQDPGFRTFRSKVSDIFAPVFGLCCEAQSQQRGRLCGDKTAGVALT
jgi:hypothetical protein